ncbi:MAG TPA: SDR family NAD(P)-dependent oxidoreductase [Acidimicrobiales bacterium]|nr:SDR family NAD(P)-dependent oxidoreductase [Acidimicrobiales bacterium]
MQVAEARVVVTGASSGIGAALAPLLAERGATVGIVARRADRLAEVLERCRRHRPGSRMWVADLGDTDAAEALARRAWAELDGIDVLVNNAAVPKRRAVTDLTLDEIRHTMAVNFESPVRMSLAVLPCMLERGRGVIVNVSSFGGRVGIPGEAAYCASKFALAGWSEAMQLDLWDTPVDVRLVLPGAVATEIWDQPGNDPPLYDGPFEPAEDVAAGIVDAIEGDRFEHYLPDMKPIVELKTGDVDGFLAGVVAFARDRRP